jgi:transcriptional regulator with XRE-family HTH domain
VLFFGGISHHREVAWVDFLTVFDVAKVLMIRRKEPLIEHKGFSDGPLNRKSQMAHPVDVHVGKRIRHRRWLVGMTQQQLAERVGIKFQQIQKYETGANRVSASRLWDIADALEVPVSFFFEGIETENADMPAEAAADSVPADILGDKEALDLVRSYYAIPENQRRRLFELARVLSDVA